MKKVFKLLYLFSFVILFSSNLFASSSSGPSDDESEDESELNIDGKILPKFLIRSKDGKKFKVEGINGNKGGGRVDIPGGGSINIPLEDEVVWYIHEGAFGNTIRDIRFYYDARENVRTFSSSNRYPNAAAVYYVPANEIEPGFYFIREGNIASYLRLEEIHNF